MSILLVNSVKLPSSVILSLADTQEIEKTNNKHIKIKNFLIIIPPINY